MSELYGALTRTDDDVTVSFERDQPATADVVWASLTEPDRLARWLVPVEGELHKGGTVHVRLEDGDVRLTVDRCHAPDTLVVHWHHEDRDSTVRASVFPTGDGSSRLTLVHEGLSLPEAPSDAARWHRHLDALDGLLADRDADNDVDRNGWDRIDEHYRAAEVGVRTAHQ